MADETALVLSDGYFVPTLRTVVGGSALKGRLTWRSRLESRKEVDKLKEARTGLVVSLESPGPDAEIRLRDVYGTNWIKHPIPDPLTEHLPEDVFYDALISAVHAMSAALERGNGVCVHCQGGTDRSPGLVAAFLTLHRDPLLDEEARKIPLSSRMQSLVEYASSRYLKEHGPLPPMPRD